jgi:hypothetical protein
MMNRCRPGNYPVLSLVHTVGWYSSVQVFNRPGWIFPSQQTPGSFAGFVSKETNIKQSGMLTTQRSTSVFW